MKKVMLSLITICVASSSFSQTPSPTALYKKKKFIGVNFILNDFRTTERIKNTSISSVFNTKSIAKISEMSPGLSVNYFQGLTDHLDLMATVGGSFADLPGSSSTTSASNTSRNTFLLETDASINLKLLTDRYIFTPYFTTGVGVSMYSSTFGAYLPIGLGFQAKLSEESFLFLNSQYRVGVSQSASNHLNYSIGFAAPIGGGSK